MNAGKVNWLKRALRAELFSPAGFVVRAALITVAYAICELGGLREHTTFLSGTGASSDGGFNGSVVWGVTCMVAWFGVVLVAPVLLLAAGLLALFRGFKGD